MEKDLVLSEGRRLHALGFAIHWLKPASKMPVESGWTTGPRKEWEYLERTYHKGFNIGVRLGEPSRLTKGFLCVLDLDVKSADERYLKEALRAARAIIGERSYPVVRSGRGNGSRHYYALSEKPFKTFNPAQSKEIIKVHQPSKKPSRVELESLTKEEIDSGIRLSHAWELSLYSDGRQVVLPPSIHPDTGSTYRWSRVLLSQLGLPLLPIKRPDTGSAASSEVTHDPSEKSTLIKEGLSAVEDFKVENVDLDWLPISDEVRAAIKDGTYVKDRSGYLLRASSALFSAGLSQNEVLSVLTDPKTFLGAVGYDHAKTKSRKRAAEWVYKYTTRSVEKERSPEVFKSAPPTTEGVKLSPAEIASQNKGMEEEKNWRDDLIVNKNRMPSNLIQNVHLVTTNEVSPSVIRHDEFSYRDIYTCNTPWGGKKAEIVRDGDVDEMQLWCGKNFRFEPSKNIVESAFTIIARQNAFDPVKDFLNGLPEWDEVPRLDAWLSENFEAQGDLEYTAQVFRKWMVAMVMRVYQPGAKFDWMPIFEGAQGVGKSSFGKILVGEKYFLDWLPNLHDKDSALSLQGMWAVEMGELSQFRRNELETIKAFLTRTVDKMRPPYGRRLIESPRRCVFFGTTNRDTYLIDETGNRRFKPVVVGKLNFKALKRDRKQLFAEAVWLFKSGKETEFGLELTGEARAFEHQIHRQKMVEDDSHSMQESMLDFIEKITKKEVSFDLSDFRIMDLFSGGGCLGGWRKENRNLQFAAKMLKRIGARSTVNEGRKHWNIPSLVGGLGGNPPPEKA